MTRFDLDMDGSMEPSEQGEWVRYEDTQRTWVGLTDKERLELWLKTESEEVDRYAFANAIEAKLKEKNGWSS